jgi:diguanylate cyclase (GGDEF)-like protein
VNPFYFQNHALEFPICPFFLIVFSNIICTLAARNLRAHILEMKRLSIIDPLTQLRNRRGLDQAMETEVVRQRRDKNRLSVAVIDLDGFKGLNDTMGHKAGDKALTLFADISRNLLRQTDTICRLGGDEFVIVMPNTHATDCETLCNVLCQTVRTSLSTALSYPMSASIGFTTIENAIENSNKATDDILSIADKALYQAKALGKGCVVRGYAEEHSSLI